MSNLFFSKPHCPHCHKVRTSVLLYNVFRADPLERIEEIEDGIPDPRTIKLAEMSRRSTLTKGMTYLPTLMVGGISIIGSSIDAWHHVELLHNIKRKARGHREEYDIPEMDNSWRKKFVMLLIRLFPKAIYKEGLLRRFLIWAY